MNLFFNLKVGVTMNKDDIINRINHLDDVNLYKFLCIADHILDLLYNGADTPNNQMSYSEKLRKARKENNLTQIELANKLNISKGCIGNIESNRRNPSRSIAKKLSQYFKTSLDYWI